MVKTSEVEGEGGESNWHKKLTFQSPWHNLHSLVCRTFHKIVVAEQDQDLVCVDELPGHECERPKWYLEKETEKEKRLR